MRSGISINVKPSDRKRLRAVVKNRNAPQKETNEVPKPFVWTADPEKIIAAVKRGHHVLDSIH